MHGITAPDLHYQSVQDSQDQRIANHFYGLTRSHGPGQHGPGQHGPGPSTVPARWHAAPQVVPQLKTAWQVLLNSDHFDVFRGLVLKAGLAEYLDDPARQITLFAVPDTFFRRLPEHIVRELHSVPAYSLIAHHILPYRLLGADMNLQRGNFKTLHQYEDLHINGLGVGTIKLSFRHVSNTVNPTAITHPAIINSDIPVTNGVVHIINSPLLPRVDIHS